MHIRCPYGVHRALPTLYCRRDCVNALPFSSHSLRASFPPPGRQGSPRRSPRRPRSVRRWRDVNRSGQVLKIERGAKSREKAILKSGHMGTYGFIWFRIYECNLNKHVTQEVRVIPTCQCQAPVLLWSCLALPGIYPFRGWVAA